MWYVAILCPNWSIRCRDTPFFDFQDGGRQPSWMVACLLGPSTKCIVVGCLYHCVKFGWNQHFSFEHM